jgi:hypothetical protein
MGPTILELNGTMGFGGFLAIESNRSITVALVAVLVGYPAVDNDSSS